MRKIIFAFFELLLGAFSIYCGVINIGKVSFWWVILVVGIFLIIVGIFELSRYLKKSKTKELPIAEEAEKIPPEYRRKSSLLSRQEKEFYNTLATILSDKYMILPQMALVGVIDKITQTAYRNELFRMIDFLIVDKTTFAPKLLIELNDSSHNRADRIERDKKVNSICESAKMPLLTISSQSMQDIPALKKAIRANILK